MSRFRLSVQIYGPLIISWNDGRALSLTSAKQRAMLALLATSPGHARTRSWLQTRLWSDLDDHHGRANLRQNMFQLRRALGDRFDAVICSEGDLVSLIDGAFELTGSAKTGDFLEGIDIAEEGFEDWLRTMRSGGPALSAHHKEETTAGVRLHPRLAVLPFLEYPPSADGALGDAVAQALTRVLSRAHLIDMVAHLSSRSFHSRNHDFDSVSTALMVDYLVTGRCSRSAEMLVLDVDFQEVGSGSLIWSDRFTLSFENFLAGQSARIHEIARNIVRSILSVSVELGVTQPLPSVASHALLMSGIALMYNLTESNLGRALNHFDEVVERAPRHAIPRAWRAHWYLLRLFQGWSDDTRRDRQRAADEVAAALDLNPECAFSLATCGNVKINGDFDSAERSLEAALRLNPSSPLACRLKSVLRCYEGKGPEAVFLAERALSLSPCDPRGPFFDGVCAAAYAVDGQFEKAVELAERSLRAYPLHASAHRGKIVGLVRLGRMQEAADEAQRLLRNHPNTTVAGYLASHPAGRTPVGRGWAEALREAGIPEG